MHLLFDPILLAVPTDDAPLAHLEFVERLVAWDGVTRDEQHHCFVSVELAGALVQDGCYPDWHTLSRRWSEVGVRLAPDAAATVARRLLLTNVSLETFFAPSVPGMLDLAHVQVEDSTFAVQPDLLTRLPQTAATAFRHALARTAWLRDATAEAPPASAVAPDPANLLLVTRAPDEAAESLPAAAIRAEVLVDADADLAPVRNELPLVTTPAGLDQYFDLNAAWSDPAAVIRQLARRMIIAPPDALFWRRLERFRVGDDFAASIKRCQIHRKAGYLRKVFRQCVLLMADDPSTHDEKQHHRLGQGNTPISRGRWQAWRLWINSDSPGYRLHYWRDDNNFIFMHVRFHGHLKIDDPPR